MITSIIRRSVLLSVAICFAVLPVANTAQAGIIATHTAIEISDREQRIDRVNELLAGKSVHSAMVKLGVDPADASARLNSLTAEELQLLEENLTDMPAGAGFIEVVGIVAIVLIVLELLEVTDIFKSI